MTCDHIVGFLEDPSIKDCLSDGFKTVVLIKKSLSKDTQLLVPYTSWNYFTLFSFCPCCGEAINPTERVLLSDSDKKSMQHDLDKLKRMTA